MSRRHLQFVPLGALVLALLFDGVPAVSAAQAGQPSGFRALAEGRAAAFQLPADVRLVGQWQIDGRGPGDRLTARRYQQFAARSGATVDGAQLTVVVRDGKSLLVVGAHYPRSLATNRVVLSAAEAVARAARDRRLEPDPHAGDAPAQLPLAARRDAGLMLDPDTGRLFYRVETRAAGVRTFHSVDAQTGEVFAAVDALAHDHGRGVKGDLKSMGGGAGTADNLTRTGSGQWVMRSVDGRLATFDNGNEWSMSPTITTDADNHWTATSQRPAVDAHYYTRRTDDFFRRQFGFDVLDPTCGYGQIRSVVRFGQAYANAYWDGESLVYGQGDGSSFGPLSGAQDVVSHELTHAVTECTSGLFYVNQSGALNEAFSDIMATASEFEIAEPLSSNCRRAAGQAGCADWWIAEDAMLGRDALGVRNLARPALGDQPSHYSGLYTGSWDSGGVHTNSGIPNHAFFLMVTGGRNARCEGGTDPAADCDVFVPPVGMADAQRMAFAAYTALPGAATFCDARAATVAVAQTLFPGSAAHVASADLAWTAVGLTASACGAGPADFSIRVPERSISLPADGEGQLQVALERGSETGPVEFSVAGAPDGWSSFTSQLSAGPGGGDRIALAINVPAGAATGVYPLWITASSASATRHAFATLLVDATAPVTSVPVVRFASGGRVSTAGEAPIDVFWSASDGFSGLASAYLQSSVNGGAWTSLAGAAAVAGRTQLQLVSGTYRFRVRAVDKVGNETTSASSPLIGLTGLQESAAKYSSGWPAPVASPAWGTVRTSATVGSRTTLTFTGSQVAWVSTKGPQRGKATILVDGVEVARVNLYAASKSPRQIVFRRDGLAQGSHTLRIVVRGTSGRSVDVDGFLVLGQ